MEGLAPKPRLLEQFRSVMRLHHYSIRTQKSYQYFIRFRGMRHPVGLSTLFLSQSEFFLGGLEEPGESQKIGVTPIY